MKGYNFPTDSYLKSLYTILLETGMILTLLGFLLLTNVNLNFSAQNGEVSFEKQEPVSMEDIIQTKQPERPPLPPGPMVPVEVPNNEVIEDQVIAIDAELDFDEPLEIPEPPAEAVQKEEDAEEDFFVVVEEMPELIGAFRLFNNKIKYPDVARQAGIEGLVIIQFVVNEQGKVENPIVIRGIGGGCDQEAIRVVKKAQFKPGKQRGQPVRVQYSLPIFFKLKS
ncbi:MAG: energy transducer TonB [Balneolaceae bacterium]|nr:energy transducer TonB [Balneolaceae bacterium]